MGFRGLGFEGLKRGLVLGVWGYEKMASYAGVLCLSGVCEFSLGLWGFVNCQGFTGIAI